MPRFTISEESRNHTIYNQIRRFDKQFYGSKVPRHWVARILDFDRRYKFKLELKCFQTSSFRKHGNTMTKDTRISLRLGPLHEAVLNAADKAGVNPSEWIRRAVAKQLGVDPPEPYQGNMDLGKHAKKAAKARWDKPE